MLVAPVDNDIYIPCGPAISSDDFKTRSIVAFGDVSGNIIITTATAGQSMVPISATADNWSHTIEGVHSLKILSAVNSFVGVIQAEINADGILPFGSPMVQIVPQAVYDSFVAGTSPFPGNQVIVGPLTGATRAQNFIGDPLNHAMFRGENKIFIFSVIDADENPVDMSGMSLRYVIENMTTNALVATADSVVATGAGNDVANVTVLKATNLPMTAGEYKWRLWDDTAGNVLLHGKFILGGTSES